MPQLPVDQRIGLEETDDGVWSIYFNTVLLATISEDDQSVTHVPGHFCYL
jgi:hypothetical protein